MFDIDSLNFEKGNGTVTVVAQDANTGQVLMVAAADREAVEKTIATNEMHYRSRTRGLWHKGATSGNTQRVVSLAADCDGDALLARVIPKGPACHNGTISCFGDASSSTLSSLDATIRDRAEKPAPASYTNRLLADRNLRLKKIGEESAELVVALADRDVQRAKEEAADLIYHVLVALRAESIGLDEVESVLALRSK
jgi:phosphoribosyl-ATP pyrophosphohydrolase/phosphoribosyl-AMP cyclohydrolase